MASQCKEVVVPENLWANWYMKEDDHKHENCVVHFTDVAQPPSKDFYQVFVTNKEIVLNIWKIVPPTRQEKSLPSEFKDLISEFQYDDKIKSELQRVGGSTLLNYLTEICKGHLDYLPRLQKKLLIKLVLMLDLEDISSLSRVNKQFRELCNSDEIWSKIYAKNSEAPITDELRRLAEGKGWKRLFFTNKLQLQMHLRRMKIPDAPPAGGYAFLTSQDQELENQE